MDIFNLTQHQANSEQVAQGVVEPSEEDKKQIQSLLTFEEIPNEIVMLKRARQLADIALRSNCELTMIGGAPFFMSPLEYQLTQHGLKPVYAFSRREVIEEQGEDGQTKKTAIFRHLGFVGLEHINTDNTTADLSNRDEATGITETPKPNNEFSKKCPVVDEYGAVTRKIHGLEADARLSDIEPVFLKLWDSLGSHLEAIELLIGRRVDAKELHDNPLLGDIYRTSEPSMAYISLLMFKDISKKEELEEPK